VFGTCIAGQATTWSLIRGISIAHGAVAKLADALDLGSSSFGSAGSTPVSPIFLFSLIFVRQKCGCKRVSDYSFELRAKRRRLSRSLNLLRR